MMNSDAIKHCKGVINKHRAIEISGRSEATIQKHIALREVEELKLSALEENEKLKAEIEQLKNSDLSKEESSVNYYNLYKQSLDEIARLKEKEVAKKVEDEVYCPICGTCNMDDDGLVGDYCLKCGQKLDWGE